SFDPVPSIAVMAEKLRLAAGKSSNYELVVTQRKLGGNGPIMANALASLGLDVTYIGSVGAPEVHPVFQDFAAKARVIGVVDAGHTDALEFNDGKIMLGKYTCLNDLTWENLIARVGRPELDAMIDGAALIGMVNWTMIPQMSQIWEHLLDEVFVKKPTSDRLLFIDLADPEKRTADDLVAALRLVGRFQEHVGVILGLNLKEAGRVVDVLGLPRRPEPLTTIREDAEAIREALGIGCVVIHPRRGAAAAKGDGSAMFDGPFVEHPLISTGAGDHFNAGFCLGQMLGLDLEQSLCAGVAASGYYVRHAQSPTVAELAAFVADLPKAEALTSKGPR
ncbi:MAG: carbohydrate kinase family protein, partial [Isosphaeraceae bacterium]